MPELAIAVDARDAAAFTVFAGVPLAIRQLRLAAREGKRDLVLVTSDPVAAEKALARRPVRAQVKVVSEPPPGVPLISAFEGVDLANLAAAEDALYASLRKSVDMDGFVAYHVIRPLTRHLTRRLVDTEITPNQVTLFAMALGITAGLCSAFGAFALAGLLYFAGSVVDCVDGEMARLRIEGSKAGEWLDSLADEVSTLALLSGVASGLGGVWSVLGVLGLVTGVPALVKLYFDLDRLGLPIDTARYPWFFLAGPARSGGLLYCLSFLFKRDAYATLIALALVAGCPRLAFSLLFIGLVTIAILLVIHLALTRDRRDG